MTAEDAVIRALERAIEYLCAAQHLSGNWTDFWVSVGTSDEWVTLYTGLALAEASRCDSLSKATRHASERAARVCAEWLLSRERPGGGWGYNASVPADADSTANAISLFAELRAPVPPEALAFLNRQQVAGQGFRTYAFDDAAHEWTRPCADVTAAALRALFHAGELDPSKLRCAWSQALAPAQDAEGLWRGYWWATPNYTTALVLEVWSLNGRPRLPRAVGPLPSASAFDEACRLLALCRMLRTEDASSCSADLCRMQQHDGAWPGGAPLRVPSSHPHKRPWQSETTSRDARRIFTTATAVRALLIAAPLIRNSRPAFMLHAGRGPARSRQGVACNQVLATVAKSLGFSAPHVEAAAGIFALLTKESLDDRTVWPAPQLSSLSGGMPLEFSVNAAETARPDLRYTVEPGDVQASPPQRVRSAMAAIHDAAKLLGYEEGWERARAALDILVSPQLLTSEWQRFLVWGGVDHKLPASPSHRSSFLLKLYVHLLPDAARRRLLNEALSAVGIPVSSETATTLDLLEQEGFAQEIGFGFGARGRFGCKVYYELSGWRRALVKRLLHINGLPTEVDALCPAIPGLLSESLAAKSRGGIALRFHVGSGVVEDVATAAEFIQGFLPPVVVADRIDAWADANGYDSATHRNVFNALATSSDATDRLRGPRHTLFTRTITRAGQRWATIYLRPGVHSLNGAT